MLLLVLLLGQPMFLVCLLLLIRFMFTFINKISILISECYCWWGYIFTCRHRDCIFSNGQARQEKPSDNKLFWNGNALVFNKTNVIISQSAGFLTRSPFYPLKGASMLLLALSFTWKALAPYSGTLAVVGTVL
jgi:hypothetical protein